jgi:hypothetical protein
MFTLEYSKKAIKTNGETIEVGIINLFGFTFKDNIFEWGDKIFKIIQIAHLKNKLFTNGSKL